LLPQGHSYSNGGETKPANQAVASQATLLWYTRFTEASPDRVAGLVAPLLQADSSLRLIVFGDEVESGDKDRAQAAFRALGVSGRVQWVAYGPGGLGALLTQHSDPVGIYPLDDDLTDRARSPTKLVELMAHGVPVVAEAVGEARRYLGTFENECLAPVANPELFQARVSRLLAKRSTRIELGERLGFAASAWHWDRLARGLLDWYDELAAGRL
jgi:glycosyltransferase involved in cell wall biosynthesis